MAVTYEQIVERLGLRIGRLEVQTTMQELQIEGLQAELASKPEPIETSGEAD